MEKMEVLKKALQGEMDGFYHYSNAALNTSDERAKKIFEILAQEEKLHYEFLLKYFNFLTDKEEKVDLLKFKGEKRYNFSGESPIFSEDFKKKIREKHIEISALSIGMVLEQNSIEFYMKLEEKEEDPDTKEFLKELISWEENHLDALAKQKRFFMESYWSNAHFEPF